MEGVRWGDLPIIPDTESGIAAIEREQITKPRSMELEGPQLHQPSYSESPSTLEISSECLFPDNLVIKTVKLVQHAKKLKAVVQSFQLQQETQKGGSDAETTLVYPPLPAMPIGIDDASSSAVKESKPDDKSQIDHLNSIVLDNNCALLVLRKAVAIICAHVGFEITMESVLSILTDIAQEFFVKLCLQLRQGTDNPNPGFPDVFEQAFHEMGLGSVKSIQTFHQTRIVDYYNNVLNQCKHWMNEYEKLKQPDQQNIDTRIHKVKEENIVPIQFPISEDIDETIDHSETVIHLEELHGLHNIEHVPATTLGDDEGPKWPLPHGPKLDINIHNQTPTLDSDDEIIDVSDSPDDSSSNMHVDLINIQNPK